MPGLYRGKVESIDDPDRLGRVRVRVYAVHGDDHRTPDSALPWCEVAEQGGGGYDFGSYDPPPVGSAVFVGFEGGDPEFPIVLGTWRGVPKRNDENPNVFLTKGGKPPNEKPWRPPDEELETPKDVFEGVYRGDPHPTRRVWKKSYKGHTILVEDGDGKEFIKIIDRAGQIIEMDCPVEKTNSQGNAAQRGVRDAIRGDQLPHSAMKGQRASVRIRDLSGQEIYLDAKDRSERVVILGRSRDGSVRNKIVLDSSKARSGILLQDSAGNKIRMDPNSSNPIQITDAAGNGLITDKDNGSVKLVAQKTAEDEVPQKKLTVKGTKESDIAGDEIKNIKGNKETQVVNDASVGVLGAANVSIGGAIKLVVTNNKPGGPPTYVEREDNSIDISVADLLGSDFALTNKMGNVFVTVEDGGAIQFTVKELLGVSELGTFYLDDSGNFVVDNTKLIELISGEETHIGGNAGSATEPLVKGAVLLDGWKTAIDTLKTAAAGMTGPIAAVGTALTAYCNAITPLMTSAKSDKSFTA